MGSTGHPTEVAIHPPKDPGLCLESPHARSLSPSPSQRQSTFGDRGLTTKLLMVWPLALHFLGSVVVAVIFLHILNGHQFYLERRPKLPLADGSYEFRQLGQYQLLQSDITTILSVLLMILRWIAASWAIPLCWRAIFVIGGRNGLHYGDIQWVNRYGIFRPRTYLRHPLHLLLGLILILTLGPQPSAPLLTGSISWLPSNQTVDLPYHPSVKITGNPPNDTGFTFFHQNRATYSTNVIKNFNTAWSQAPEEFVFKRVVPSVARLSVGSTVDNILLPYFMVSGVEWLPNIDDNSSQLFNSMRLNQTTFPGLSDQMMQLGAAALIVNMTQFNDSQYRASLSTWSILINVGTDASLQTQICNSTTTILSNTTIPVFPLAFSDADDPQSFFGCFSYAKLSFDAGFGLCHRCRVGSFSTVQNDTELQIMQDTKLIQLIIRDMPQYISAMSPLQDSLPDPALSLDAYATALLTRLYSALWNSWTDQASYARGLTSEYRPAVPMLRAEIHEVRVYAWLSLQILFTVAGLAFLWVQSRSRYPLYTDTEMVAFDLDSTQVSKPNPLSKDRTNELLLIEPKGNGWKVVVAD